MSRIPTIGTKIKLEGGRAVAEDLNKIGASGRRNLRGLRGDFRVAARNAQTFGRAVSGAVGTLGRLGRSTARGLTLGVAGGLTAAGVAAEGVRRSVDNANESILEIEKAAKRAGLEFKNFALLEATLTQFDGVRTDNVQEFFGTLSERIAEAAVLGESTPKEALEFLGIDPDSLVRNADEISQFRDRLKSAKSELEELQQFQGASLRELAIREAGPNASLSRLQREVESGDLRQNLQREIEDAQQRIERLQGQQPRAQLRRGDEVFRLIAQAARQQGEGPRTTKALQDLGGSDANQLGRAIFADPSRLRALAQQAIDAGIVPGQSDLQQARRNERARQILGVEVDGLIEIVRELFSPTQNQLYLRLAAEIRKNRPEIARFVTDFSEFVSEELNALIDLLSGANIEDRDATFIVQFYDAVRDARGDLERFAEVVSDVADYLIELAQRLGIIETTGEQTPETFSGRQDRRVGRDNVPNTGNRGADFVAETAFDTGAGVLDSLGSTRIPSMSEIGRGLLNGAAGQLNVGSLRMPNFSSQIRAPRPTDFELGISKKNAEPTERVEITIRDSEDGSYRVYGDRAAAKRMQRTLRKLDRSRSSSDPAFAR